MHPRPGFTGLIGARGDAQYIFITVRIDARHDIGSTAYDTPIFSDFVMDAVCENKRMNRIQWPWLPFFDFRQYPVRNLTDHFSGPCTLPVP